MQSRQAIGIIPARWASTRFPGKPLALIRGKPLLHWVVERVRQAERLDRVVVATDDERIRQCAEAIDAPVAMTRSDHPSGTDRIAEAAGQSQADIVINIQGDEPLISPQLIDELVAAFSDDEDAWDMVTAAERISDPQEIANPDVVKVVFGGRGQALYFSRAPVPFHRDESRQAESEYWRHIGIYGYTASFLARYVSTPPCELEETEKLEQLRALEMGCNMKVIETRSSCVGVDRPEDIGKVEDMLGGFFEREG